MTSDQSRTIVVTGANRGLGLEFCRQWLANGDRVLALARRPEDSAGLTDLAAEYPERLVTASCDVADDDSVAAAARALPGDWGPIEILVNNAGYYGQRSEALAGLDFDDVRRTFEINTLGPLRILRAFGSRFAGAHSPRAVQVTSLMGSIDDNTSGGRWAYRMSKAALNMANRNLAHELSSAGVCTVALHPGWVRTDMGGSGAPLGIEEAVTSMVQTIENLTLAASGAFIDRNGGVLPW